MPVIGAALLLACPAYPAIGPDQIVLVVNKNAPEGLRIARSYMQKRQVPGHNMIEITTTRKEEIDREAYEKQIAAPVRSFLKRNDPEGNRFACLVLLSGIPLRIRASQPALRDGGMRAGRPLPKPNSIEKKAQAETGSPSQGTNPMKRGTADARDVTPRLIKPRQDASVDSELALVMEKAYPLEGWLPNRYYIGFRDKNIPGMPRNVIPVCRLDGPTEASVHRIIADSLYAERNGLAGTAYFDARWPDNGARDGSPYRRYDRAIHHTARMVKERAGMPVVIDEREALFASGQAREAALYCGWYSLGKYVDAFTWSRGAVGYHVASAECTTLKAASSTVWCRKMLEKGAAATLGPVAEPYLQSFPAPEVFFGCLIGGGSLIECYTISNPFWSWQMVLIGDPLYRPFKERDAEPGKPSRTR
ncbi:MAG TPA: TIGR03790 family protein [Deltaproteobacteria bacterium]|nr:TIGR03790 family protein [Deltaproteobacteria bacterium]